MKKIDKSEILMIGKNAKEASRVVSLLDPKLKNEILKAASENLQHNSSIIIDENRKDVEENKDKLTSATLDRLVLDEKRIKSMCEGLEDISRLDDPIGKILDKWDRPNGLKIEKVSIPLGVIGVIYESRPNVSADAAGLTLKSGNTLILRGGSESFNSSSKIVSLINQIERVLTDSKVHVIRHLDGICHTYIHKKSDPNLCKEVTFNAKMRRPGICGATETILIDYEVLNSHLHMIITALQNEGCLVKGDKEILKINDSIELADETDWATEYLDKIISIKTIKGGVKEAVNHINEYGSGHTDAILSEDQLAVDYFLNNVDSGIVMHNTSTQFADGGEFGMGAEIGISTSKVHARGPVGVAQLTSFKYKVLGTGQIRP